MSGEIESIPQVRSSDSKNAAVERHSAADKGLSGERDEQTALGSVIGAARDLFQGEVQDVRKRSERAESNDEIAKIAVDTIASVPKLHIVGAGAVRALSLINVHEDLRQNMLAGMKNFAEGVALNKVSHLAANDSASLFISGAANGAIRTGFDEHTWHDKDGQFHVNSTLSRIATGSFAGGALNIPAGLLGAKVTKMTLGAVSENAISSTSAHVLSSLTSGYASGSVYGGLDAIVAGGNATDVLGAMNRGGITGALSGGLVHGLSGRVSESQPLLEPNSKQHTPFDFSLRAIEASATRDVKEPVKSLTAHRDQQEELYRSLAFDLVPHPPLKELESRLIMPFRIHISSEMRVMASARDVKWKSEDDFNRHLESHDVKMVVYGARGKDGKRLPVEIHVPESHNKNVIEPIRELRRLAQTDLPIDNESNYLKRLMFAMAKRQDAQAVFDLFPPHAKEDVRIKFQAMTPEERVQVGQVFLARERLSTHAHRTVLTPEDIIPFLDQSKNVQKIVLSDKHWERDAWMRQNKDASFYDPNFTAAATARWDAGSITFHKGQRPDPVRPQTANSLSDLFHHEDTHLMRDFKPAYEAAYLLDSSDPNKPLHAVSNYARLNSEEDRAESRTAFLQPDPDAFYEMAQNAPMRTAVLARAENDNLVNFVDNGGHPYERGLENRIEYVHRQIEPIARQMARDRLRSSEPKHVIAAAELLGIIGDKPDIPHLEVTARLDARSQLALTRRRAAERGEAPKSIEMQRYENQRAGDPSNSRNQAAKAAFSSMIKLSGDTSDERFAATVAFARNDQTLRHLAIEKMQDGSFGETGIKYAKVLRNFGDPSNVGTLRDAVSRTDVMQLKQWGFAEVIRLTKSEPDQIKYAWDVFDNDPALQQQAITFLVEHNATNRLIGRY